MQNIDCNINSPKDTPQLTLKRQLWTTFANILESIVVLERG